ncbi:MAG: hypothetical protein NT089_07650 [Planctomycetia bacterium]|nr:hypothetical protein [Planctomycetia bacterium]
MPLPPFAGARRCLSMPTLTCVLAAAIRCSGQPPVGHGQSLAALPARVFIPSQSNDLASSFPQGF